MGGAAEATQEERSDVALSPENARLRWLTDGKAERNGSGRLKLWEPMLSGYEVKVS
jgi:hypothetical protein